MDFMSDGMSIAEMVANAAAEVYHLKVPPGFEFIQEYGQYYSRSTGYYYDPSTGLFFHNDTQTYYIFNEETYQYEVYKCIKPLKWSGKKHEDRARRILNENFDRLDQESADICGMLLSVVDKICKREARERMNSTLHGDDDGGRIRFLKRQLARQQTRFQTREIIQTDDPGFVCFYSEQPIETEREGAESADEYSDLSDAENGQEDLDERKQMMEEEGFSHAPLIRLIDDEKNLHILTIPGGLVGRDPSSEVLLDHPAVPERLLSFTFLEESNSFVLKKLTYLRVVLNDYELEYDETKEVVHGDMVYFQGKTLVLHVHYGNNTCPGCEPGLLKDASISTIAPQTARGETARRRTMKMLKAAYGINGHEEQKFAGFDRAAHRRRHVGSEGPPVKQHRPVDPNNIYSGCLARPVAAPSTSAAPKPAPHRPATAIGAENKGFKLLKGMGWKEGEGLGKANLGRVEPVMNEVKNDRAGLGAAEQQQKPKYNSQKEAIMDVTRRRYQQIESEKK